MQYLNAKFTSRIKLDKLIELYRLHQCNTKELFLMPSKMATIVQQCSQLFKNKQRNKTDDRRSIVC